MHIGVNTLFLIPGEVGGSETYLCRTLEAIATGYPSARITLFTNNENDAVLRNRFEGFRQIGCQRILCTASRRSPRILKEQFLLPSRVKMSGADILWSPGYTACIFSPVPQVVSILDMQYKSFPEDLTPPARFVTDILVRMAARRCKGILTISEFSKQEILKYTAARADRIWVTHLASHPFHPAEGPNPAGEKPYILTVANSYPHKNLHQLVEAFALLENKIPHNLVVVGHPRLGENRLQQALSGINDKGRIVRLSGVSTEVLDTLYAGAAVFVFPSLYEGFGLPILEAMSAGTPVITTLSGSLPEAGGDAAVYYHPPEAASLAQKIEEVTGMNREKRQQLILKGREQAVKYSWANTAGKTLVALKSILRG
ncbi:MAG TPA: glycosyltransferase family 1 protein [Kiritimatiellia bacterium]|nr:glycosyltransferase family 1 protein [Kiritimatiellia bacterium]